MMGFRCEEICTLSIFVLVGITFVYSGVLIANKINQVSYETSVTDILKKQISRMIYEWESVSGDKKQERLKKFVGFLGNCVL